MLDTYIGASPDPGLRDLTGTPSFGGGVTAAWPLRSAQYTPSSTREDRDAYRATRVRRVMNNAVGTNPDSKNLRIFVMLAQLGEKPPPMCSTIYNSLLES